jgi:hypothetical protein
MERMTKAFAPHVALFLLVSALATGTALAQAVDWQAAAPEETVVILTKEEDGAPRETTVWLVVIDGQGYVRTGDTHWHQNIVREPQIGIRIAEKEYPVRAAHVTDPALRAKVHAAMREKYGFSDTFVGWFSNEEAAQIMRLEPREIAPAP